MDKKDLVNDALGSAFKSEVSNLYKVLYSSLINPGLSQEGKDQAVERFSKGISNAIEAYDMAEEAISKIQS
jgi:hypothetical protein